MAELTQGLQNGEIGFTSPVVLHALAASPATRVRTTWATKVSTTLVFAHPRLAGEKDHLASALTCLGQSACRRASTASCSTSQAGEWPEDRGDGRAGSEHSAGTSMRRSIRHVDGGDRGPNDTPVGNRGNEL